MPAPLIAHILYRLDYGGLENGVVNLINGLPPEDSRHAIICLTEAADFRRRIRRTDVEIHELHKQPGQDPAAYFRLWKLLRRLRPAVVHTRNTGVIDCQLIARLAGVPGRLHGYHGWDMDDLTGDNPKRNLLRRLCDPAVMRYIVVSQQIERWLQGRLGVSGQRISQIYNGVDTERFRPSARSGDQRLVIGTVGRLQAVKNQILLVEAIAELLRNRPELKQRVDVRLVGDGPERAAIESAIQTFDLGTVVRITGWKDDVADALAAFSVFVLPSRNEGISNTILEAMACALPVVATDVGGNPELVDDGETGYLVPAGDPAAMAERLGRYIDSPELVARHGAAGRRRTETEFSIRGMLGRYAAVYRELSRIPGT